MKTIRATKGVVLCYGGFSADVKFRMFQDPKLNETLDTTNQPGATSEMWRETSAIGALQVQNDWIQCGPWGCPREKGMGIGWQFNQTAAAEYGLWVNAEGKRFTNELLTRDVVSAAELKQPGRFAWVFWDDATRKSAKLMDSYISMGLAVKGNTVAEIAKAMNVPAAELEATLKAYAAGKAAGKDAFGRADMPQAMQTAPFFAVKVQPAVHHTMGGVKIDTKAEVLNPAGHTIPGLFAAGEVTGGVHGGNRLGGNAQADIVTFGRIAGQSADAYLKTAQ